VRLSHQALRQPSGAELDHPSRKVPQLRHANFSDVSLRRTRNSLSFCGCYLSFGLSVATVKWLFFSSILVVLIVTDYRARILPDAVNWFVSAWA